MKRATHMLTGAAMGAFVASLMGEDPVGLMVLGGVFGTVPDLDVMVARLGFDVHRSPASHSLMASVILAAGWAIALTAVGDTLDELGGWFQLWPSTIVVLSSTFLHAVEDSMTRAGCKLMYPLSRKILRGPVRYDDVAANAALSAIALLLMLVSLANDLSPLLP